MKIDCLKIFLGILSNKDPVWRKNLKNLCTQLRVLVINTSFSSDIYKKQQNLDKLTTMTEQATSSFYTCLHFNRHFNIRIFLTFSCRDISIGVVFVEITWHKTWYTNFVLQINQNQLTIFSKTCQCALIRGLVLHMEGCILGKKLCL